MKLSYQWLCEWAPTDLSAAEAGETLTLAGLELEDIEAAAPPLDGVVIGRIVSADQHPDADRLRVCSVDVGAPEPLQIVCGAPNARADLRVAVATIGTRLPGDFKIKKSKIRGVESFGMLCSGGELGLEGTDGILELPTDLTLGQSFSEALQLNDSVLEIALTPNRGDCFSVRGVARELACLSGAQFAAPFADEVTPVTIDDTILIEIENADDCSVYAGRVVRGLDRQAVTPMWMAERLRRADLRSINPLVDVTNYVLLELGQPMHAFDLAKLKPGITVRRAREGEALTLLNEQTITLSPEELIIADASGPVALAGAMGGLPTAVDDDTVDVVLESACFSPRAVAGTGRKFKLSSDSLQRFERGVDPQLHLQALERATQLLIEIAGGKAGPLCVQQVRPWQSVATPLNPRRVNTLLGSELSAEQMQEILEKLECRVERQGDQLQVSPPSHRYDLGSAIDYVEEIARIHGYDNLPGRARKVPTSLTAPTKTDDGQALRRALVARGYFEAFSFSFADAISDSALAGSDALDAVELDNPMALWMGQMRRSVWASLLPIWKRNVARQQERIRLFEIGREYHRDGQTISEREVIAGIVSGLAAPEQWATTKRNVDFYDLKADVQALLGPLAFVVEFKSDNTHPALHPGRAARIELNGETIGHLGQIHPRLKKALDLAQTPLFFVVNRGPLQHFGLPTISEISNTPSTRRDLALVIDQSLEAAKLTNYVKSNVGPMLQDVRVFDVFTGDALPKACKSVALGLIFQDFSRTLTDQEVDEAIATLTSGLEREFGAQIRG